jgi:hypothetical protein
MKQNNTFYLLAAALLLDMVRLKAGLYFTLPLPLPNDSQEHKNALHRIDDDHHIPIYVLFKRLHRTVLKRTTLFNTEEIKDFYNIFQPEVTRHMDELRAYRWSLIKDLVTEQTKGGRIDHSYDDAIAAKKAEFIQFLETLVSKLPEAIKNSPSSIEGFQTSVQNRRRLFTNFKPSEPVKGVVITGAIIDHDDIEAMYSNRSKNNDEDIAVWGAAA